MADERADRIATGEVKGLLSGELPSGSVGRDLPSGVARPPSFSRASRCWSFLFLRSIVIGSPGRTWASAPRHQVPLFTITRQDIHLWPNLQLPFKNHWQISFFPASYLALVPRQGKEEWTYARAYCGRMDRYLRPYKHLA
jgi:hypothetical protein